MLAHVTGSCRPRCPRVFNRPGLETTSEFVDDQHGESLKFGSPKFWEIHG